MNLVSVILFCLSFTLDTCLIICNVVSAMANNHANVFLFSMHPLTKFDNALALDFGFNII